MSSRKISGTLANSVTMLSDGWVEGASNNPWMIMTWGKQKDHNSTTEKGAVDSAGPDGGYGQTVDG